MLNVKKSILSTEVFEKMPLLKGMNLYKDMYKGILYVYVKTHPCYSKCIYNDALTILVNTVTSVEYKGHKTQSCVLIFVFKSNRQPQ